MLEDTPHADLSLRKIARAINLSHGAPYRHFLERSDYLTALSLRCSLELLAVFEQTLSREGAAGERFIAVGNAYVRYAVDHPNAFHLIFDIRITPPGGSSPEPVTPMRHLGLLETIATEAILSGEIILTTNSPAAVQGLWAHMHGLACLAVEGYLAPETVPAILDVYLVDPPSRVSIPFNA